MMIANLKKTLVSMVYTEICQRLMVGHQHIYHLNPLPAGAEYIGFFTQLLPHSVPSFKHAKAIM